jgi:hypothetical protein
MSRSYWLPTNLAQPTLQTLQFAGSLTGLCYDAAGMGSVDRVQTFRPLRVSEPN